MQFLVFFQALNGCMTYISSSAGAAAFISSYLGITPQAESQLVGTLCGFTSLICLRFAHAKSSAQILQAIAPPPPEASADSSATFPRIFPAPTTPDNEPK